MGRAKYQLTKKRDPFPLDWSVEMRPSYVESEDLTPSLNAFGGVAQLLRRTVDFHLQTLETNDQIN